MDDLSAPPRADRRVEPPARLLHQAFLYDSDRAFADHAGGFLREGLARGERAFVAVSRHHIALLRDVVPQPSDGTLRYVDSAAWYTTPGRTLSDYYDHVSEHQGRGRLRVVGEPRWIGRTQPQVTAWQRYESVINLTFSRAPVWVLCPYDTRVLPREVVQNARRTHPELVGRFGVERSTGYRDPVAFSAECDRAPLPPPKGQVRCRHVRPHELGEVRRFVMVWARRHGLAGERLEDLLTSVQEIATNVVKHGGGHGTVTVWVDGGDLVCDVADPGPPWDYHAAGHLPPSPDATSGLGLWLARRLCDLVEIRSDPAGSVVRLRVAAP